MILQRHLKLPSKAYSDILVGGRVLQTAEPWLRNEQRLTLYPSVLHCILGQTTSAETTVCDDPCKEQKQVLVLLTWN